MAEEIADRHERFALYRELLVGSQERQFEYGKRILASLLAVHLGGLFLLSQAEEKREHLFQFAGPWLVYGAGAALFSGGLAWINFSVVAWAYSQVVASYLKGTDYSPSRLTRAVTIGTLVIAPAAAALSLLMFFWAAYRALSLL